MDFRKNARGKVETFCKGEHKSLWSLMELSNNFPDDIQKYIQKSNIPKYPKIEFHISKIAHVTNQSNMLGILEKGFLSSDFVWWSLAVQDDDVREAEDRFLEKTFPDRTPEQKARQKPFLKEFTTSPAFKTESRYGNFRFTLPLVDVLHMYREEICEGEEPVLRVYETVVYKQEIMYSVVVHSPTERKFDEFPIIGCENTAISSFNQGKIVWQAQAMSETHHVELIEDSNQKRVEIETVQRYKQFYMWDNVTLALYLPPEKTLVVERETLIKALSACEATSRPFLGKERTTLEEAKAVVSGISGQNL